MRFSTTIVAALSAILSVDAAPVAKGGHCVNKYGGASPVYSVHYPSSSPELSASSKSYPTSKLSFSPEPSATSKAYPTPEPYPTLEPSPTSKPYSTLEPYPTYVPSPTSKAETSSKTSTPCKSSTISGSSQSASQSTHATETPSVTSSDTSSIATESSITIETSTSAYSLDTSSTHSESSTLSVTESSSTITESSTTTHVTETSSSTSESSSPASETETSSLASSSISSTSIESSSTTLETSTSISEAETPSITSSSISSTSISSASTLISSSTTSRPTPLPTQVIVDPSFEDGSDAWSWDGTALLASGTGPAEVNPHTGVRSFQGRGSVPQNPWTLNLRQTVFVAPGQTYNFEIWARQALPNVCTVTVSFDGADILNFTPATNAYSSFPTTVEVAQSSSGTGSLLIRANCIRGGPTNRLWLDDVTMTLVPPRQVIVDPSFEDGSSAWTFDGTGVLTSASGPSTVNPRTGARSFQGRGSSPQSPWALNLRQTVSVIPGNTYTLEIFARQALPNVCIVSATFNGVSIMDFTPGTAGYASFAGPVEATESSGDLVLTANCIRGGATNRLWFDDITLTLVE